MKARVSVRIIIMCGAAMLGSAGVTLADVTLNQAAVGNGPYYLNQANTTYVLTENVSCTGTAFVVAASNVSLNLNGHTVTFGTSASTGTGPKGFANPPGYGTVARWNSSNITNFTGGSNPKAYGGTFIQGAARTNGTNTSVANGPMGVHLANGGEVYSCTVTVFGNNGRAFYLEGGNVNIHDNIIRDSMAANGVTAVTDRHAGRAAIESIWANVNTRIYRNKIYGAPQWGIYIKDMNTHLFSGWIDVYDNEVYGAARRTNAYAYGARQGVSGRETRVRFYNNKFYGNTRGIHLDSGSKYEVYNNTGYHQFEDDLSEWGSDNSFGAHGIKVESAKQVEIYGNNVTTIGFHRSADPDSNMNGVSNASALNVNAIPGSAIYIHDNIFTAIIDDPSAPGTPGNQFSMGQRIDHSWGAAMVLQGPDGYTSCGDLRIENNVFRSNNRLIYWQYTGGNGTAGYTSCTIGPGNTFEQIGPQYPSFPQLWTEDYTHGGAKTSGVLILDPTFVGSGTNLQQNWNGYAGTGRVQEWFVSYSGTVRVNTGAGDPIAGVPVQATDDNGLVVLRTTDASGSAPFTLKAWEADRASNQVPVSIADYNPYTFTAQVADTTLTLSSADWNVVFGSAGIPDPTLPAMELSVVFQVLATSPLDQSMDVPSEAEMKLLLSEPLDVQSVGQDAVIVESASGRIPVSILLQNDGRVVILRPDSQFPSGEIINVRLSGTLRNAQGAFLDGNGDGEPMATDEDAFEYSFAVQGDGSQEKGSEKDVDVRPGGGGS